jgi:hypothetical protein
VISGMSFRTHGMFCIGDEVAFLMSGQVCGGFVDS